MSSRNPNWSRDELILALELYLDHGALDDTDDRVQALSDELRALRVHPVEERATSFRNPNGVAQKLRNLANHDPDFTGTPSHGGKLDGEVFADWYEDREGLRLAARAIRTASQELGDQTESPWADGVEPAVSEGALVVRLHLKRERDPRIRKRKLDQAMSETGKLACEACGFDFASAYGERGNGYAQVHHVVPLADSGPRTTRLNDLAVLCANCHAMIHRGNPWLTVDELRQIVQSRS